MMTGTKGTLAAGLPPFKMMIGKSKKTSTGLLVHPVEGPFAATRLWVVR